MYSLPTSFCYEETDKFSCISLINGRHNCNSTGDTDEIEEYIFANKPLHLHINCLYTRRIIRRLVREENAIQRTKGSMSVLQTPPLQIADFENIQWETVMNGATKASSYLVRKGLSRKAQLSVYIRRYLGKRKDSILAKAVPFTIVLDTWGAFEDMKVDFGGHFASFDCMELTNAPLRQRLGWCLSDARMYVGQCHFIIYPCPSRQFVL